MKSYLFNTEDYNLIRHLKIEPPIKIWWTPIQYIFEYEHFYIEFLVENFDNNPVSFNPFDSIMGIRINKIIGKYLSNELSIILAENKSISNLYIVRTIIYFHDFRNPKYVNHKNYSYFGCFLTNPNEKLASEIEHPYLVDIGLLINIDNDYINAYIKENEEDFFRYDEQYLLKNFDITKQSKHCEYIQI